MQKEEKALNIPVNAPDSDDYISGISSIELTIIGAILAVSLCIFIPLGLITGNTFATTAACFSIVTISIFVIRRDQYNENLIRKIQILSDYIQSQKVYDYRYVNIYESESEEEWDE